MGELVLKIIVQEVLMGISGLVIIIITLIIKGKTFSIKWDPVPNVGQIKFTYVMV